MTEEKKVVSLCPHYDQNCPTVEIDTDGVQIKDDFGGKVKMTADQWGVLLAKIKSGEVS